MCKGVKIDVRFKLRMMTSLALLSKGRKAGSRNAACAISLIDVRPEGIWVGSLMLMLVLMVSTVRVPKTSRHSTWIIGGLDHIENLGNIVIRILGIVSSRTGP